MSETIEQHNKISDSLDTVYYNDIELTERICELLKCEENKKGNESDPIGCYGCDTMYEIFEENKHKIIGEDCNYEYVIDLLAKERAKVAEGCMKIVYDNICYEESYKEVDAIEKFIEQKYLKGKG